MNINQAGGVSYTQSSNDSSKPTQKRTEMQKVGDIRVNFKTAPRTYAEYYNGEKGIEVSGKNGKKEIHTIKDHGTPVKDAVLLGGIAIEGNLIDNVETSNPSNYTLNFKNGVSMAFNPQESNSNNDKTPVIQWGKNGSIEFNNLRGNKHFGSPITIYDSPGSDVITVNDSDISAVHVSGGTRDYVQTHDSSVQIVDDTKQSWVTVSGGSSCYCTDETETPKK